MQIQRLHTPWSTQSTIGHYYVWSENPQIKSGWQTWIWRQESSLFAARVYPNPWIEIASFWTNNLWTGLLGLLSFVLPGQWESRQEWFALLHLLSLRRHCTRNRALLSSMGYHPGKFCEGRGKNKSTQTKIYRWIMWAWGIQRFGTMSKPII